MYDIIISVLSASKKNFKSIFKVFSFIYIFLFLYISFAVPKLYSSTSILLPTSNNSGQDYNSVISNIISSAGDTDPILIPYIYGEILNSYDFINEILNENIEYETQQTNIYSLLADKLNKNLDNPIEKYEVYEEFIDYYYFPEYNSFNNLIYLSTIFFSPKMSVRINQLAIDKLSEKQNDLIGSLDKQKLEFLKLKIDEIENDLEEIENSYINFLEQNSDRTSPVLKVEEQRILREISISTSLLSTSNIAYEEQKLKALEKMDTLYVINNPILPVEHYYPDLILITIFYIIIFIILTFLYYYYSLYKNDIF